MIRYLTLGWLCAATLLVTCLVVRKPAAESDATTVKMRRIEVKLKAIRLECKNLQTIE